MAAGVFLVLVLVGWAVLSYYFSSESFQRHVDSFLRPKLERRGVTFDDIDVNTLGQIRITNLRIRLPDGREILVPEVTGYTNPLGLVRGEAKMTLDISGVARRWLEEQTFTSEERRFRMDLIDESRILYVTLSQDLTDLGSDPRGDVKLEGLGFDVYPVENPAARIPIRFEDGELSLIQQVLTSDGLRFRLPNLDVLGQETGSDTIFRFDGNVRALFTSPEFVGGRVSTEVRTEPAWGKALDFLQLAEVQRKIRFLGPVDLHAELEGPVFRPRVVGTLDAPDLYLRMRGDFRQIDIHFLALKGRMTRSDSGRVEMELRGGRVDAEYFRHRDENLPHLYAHADALACDLNYADRVLELTDVKFAAYDGLALGKLRWDLTERAIPLGPGRTGDTAYRYELGFKDMDLGDFLQDVTSLDHPFEGTMQGFLEGRGRTLMLERMSGQGRVRVRGLELGRPPFADQLEASLGPTATEQLRGLPLGDLAADWFLVGGELQVPGFEVEGSQARLTGDVLYDILTLDIRAAMRLEVKPAGLGPRPALRRQLGPVPTLDASVSGMVVAPRVRYRAGS